MKLNLPYVCVPKEHGEEVRKVLLKYQLLNLQFQILSKGNSIFFPLRKEPQKVRPLLDSIIAPLDFGTMKFEEISTGPNTLEEALENDLSKDQLALLPRAYDLIGDIAVLEIPEELQPYKQQIGEKFLEVHSNFATVLNKKGAISGLMRTRDYELLAGTDKTETIHTEYGCRIAVDLAEAYFSPRLLEEHHQVAQQVQDDELVIDMFTGVGPFALHIAKLAQAKVIAIDINPTAIDLLKKSIELNRLKGTIVPVVADAHDYAETMFPGLADRIIMNHPSGAAEFASDASRLIKSGGVIHYYDFIAEPNPEQEMINKVRLLVDNTKKAILDILRVRKVRDSAPYEYQMVADIKVH